MLALLDVPTAELSEPLQHSIEQFARSGGGVLAIGGSATFATAAYRHTALEEILPVSALSEVAPRQVSLALVLVIDKSGSMGDDDRLELAKQAARRVVNLLTPQDQLGVLAFATDSSWVTPIAPDTNKPQLEERIAALRAGGGTNMYPAMQKAALALGEAVADHKQMILLTDGISVPGDFDRLSENLAREQISVSTVSIGGEADRSLLREIAQVTHGRPYHCENPADIPRVVVEEATVAAAATASHARPLVLHQLPRLNAADTPPLADAVATAAKPAAEVLLLTAAGDPLLSWWRFGSGVTLAYTAKAGLPEGVSGPALDREAQFWGRIVRQALGRPATNPWDIHLVRSGRRARLTADALEPDGAFLSDAKVSVTVTDPAGQQHVTELPLVAPGRYQADIALAALGAYEFELRLDAPAGNYVERRALVVDYADELQLAAPNEALLREVCLLSGGRYDLKVEDLFAAGGRTATRGLPLWRHCVLAAVAVLVLGALWQRFDEEHRLMSNITELQTEFFRRLRPVLRRLRARQTLAAVEHVFPLTTTVCIGLCVSRFATGYPSGWIAAVAALAPLVVAAIWGLAHPIDWSAAARAVDQRFELADRTLTALDNFQQFDRNLHLSAIAELQVRDAVDRLAPIHAGRAIDLQLSRRGRILLIAWVLALAAVVLVSPEKLASGPKVPMASQVDRHCRRRRWQCRPHLRICRPKC